MFVCCECRVLSGRDLCDELITRPEGSYLSIVRRCVWSRNLMNEEALAHRRLSHQKQTNKRLDAIMTLKRDLVNQVMSMWIRWTSDSAGWKKSNYRSLVDHKKWIFLDVSESMNWHKISESFVFCKYGLGTFWKFRLRLCAFFCVIPRCLNFICRRFGTLCPIFVGT